MNRSPARRKISLFPVLAVGGVAAVGTLFHRDAPSTLAGPVLSSTDQNNAVSAMFGLEASSVFSLAVDAKAGESLSVIVPLGGRDYTLELIPVSVRAADYQVLVQGEDGSLVPTPPSPVRTLRGWLRDEPFSRAAGSMLDDGLHVVVEMGPMDRFWIQPLGSRIAGAPADQYVVYHQSAVVSPESALDDAADAVEVISVSRPGSLSAGGINGCSVATLACETDFEYFEIFGSVQATEDRINFIVNTVNLQYERDTFITHVISGIILRSDPDDPYSDTTDALTLLEEFRQVWLDPGAPPGKFPPGNLRHMFTGRALHPAGIASAFPSVCSGTSFAVSRHAVGLDPCVTDLVAHELGHLWSASHCFPPPPPPGKPGCPQSTMRRNLLCANFFAPVSIFEIDNSRDSHQNCLAGSSCVGDLDCDGVVGINDYLILLSEFGPCPTYQPPGDPAPPPFPLPCRSDLNDDDKVAGLDLLNLFALWGPCP